MELILWKVRLDWFLLTRFWYVWVALIICAALIDVWRSHK